MRKCLKLVVRRQKLAESESDTKKLAALVASALSGSSEQASQAQVRLAGASGRRPGGREKLIPSVCDSIRCSYHDFLQQTSRILNFLSDRAFP